MSEQMIFTLVLTGARTGETISLNKCQFVNGKFVVQGDAKNVGGLIRYMGRVYKAFPQGTEELARYQEMDDGQTYLDQSPGSGESEPILGDVQPDGSADETTKVGEQPAGSGDSTSEHGAEGDGHESGRILEALSILDHKDDEHWTQGGKPAVHVVSELLNESVSRADINAVAPDFKREGG